jgi:hypothetical protein
MSYSSVSKSLDMKGRKGKTRAVGRTGDLPDQIVGDV